MNPFTIDNNFFNQTELEDIKTKVFMLRDHWKSIREKRNNPTIFSSVLPAGAYTFYFSEKEISANNEIMMKHFNYYYDKIKKKLSSHYNITIEYSSNLQFPGFHIFLNNTENKSTKFPYINFHRDNFPKLKNLLKPGKIESIIIPIALPSLGGALLYYSTLGNNNINFLTQSSQTFHYTPGMMAAWSAELLHSIAPFELLDSTECRITMQMHINLQDDSGVIFW